ncbi:MAG: bifunctional [glutamate--ammonia ligase]-adenylyl-L-tyrosine phosphorylase/[glutamate--ammonia-ligase] adenylyltransferase [Granulosicoccus sp.]
MQCDISTELLTPVFLEQMSELEETLGDEVLSYPLVAQWLRALCAVSPYLMRVIRQYPEALEHLVSYRSLESARTGNTPDAWVEELNSILQLEVDTLGSGTPDKTVLESVRQRVLRRFRHREMFRILWRDLTQSASLPETLNDLSQLADACVIAAEQWVYDSMVQRYGTPTNSEGKVQRLIILGMGKLGGHELNVSSDIDLICLWPEAGKTTGNASGRNVTDNAEFFRRSVQMFTRLLNSHTVDGFAYRVDTRLRPFGDSGPLVMNFDGLENYYLTQAREWERYAMIKSRALTGDAEDIQTLMGLITPFVYRRYLDYNAFDSLRELKRKIAVSVKQKGMVDNIKLGAGGIREVEFIGQAFQLVRGGRDERLRIRPIVSVLNQLASDGLMKPDEVAALVSAYGYLRRVENAIQMMRDEQLHSLPTNAEDQLRLITMLGETDWGSFRQNLQAHQECVSESFSGLFEVEASEDDASDESDATFASGDQQDAAMQTLWSMMSDDDVDEQVRTEALDAAGFESDDELLSIIDSVSRGAFFHRLTSESQNRVSRIAPLILRYALQADNPSQTLTRCMALVRAVAGRSGYLQVLSDQPQALARLVRLFSQSSWLANFVICQPMVIDELLVGPGAELYLSATEVAEETQQQVNRIKGAELDVQMDRLRHYRQGREMRIACAQLDGTLTLMQVSDQLSWLAESLIAAVLQLVEAPLIARHGNPCFELDGKAFSSTAAVVAYGKLGGLELGFASDLDLVFLHDSVGENQQTNGDKPVENTVFYARLAQKFVHFMGTTTPAGMLYEIDLRLRPNGTSGVLVTGIEAFANYQEGDAWTWEHQALIRTRMVFGSPELKARFQAIRSGVLTQMRSEDELREAVAKMRERMRSALGNTQEGRFHIKQDAGGVADIEFIVQFLVLAYSREHTALLGFTDNIRILEVVESLALMPGDEARALRDCYLALRTRLHRQALQSAGSVVAMDDELSGIRKTVSIIKARILGST